MFSFLIKGSIPIPKVWDAKHQFACIQWCDFTFYLIDITSINGKLDFTSTSDSHNISPLYGDSQVIIQAMNGESYFRNLILVRLLNRIKSISKSFRQIEFFHILRELNASADHAANKYMAASRNELYANQLLSIDMPP